MARLNMNICWEEGGCRGTQQRVYEGGCEGYSQGLPFLKTCMAVLTDRCCLPPPCKLCLLQSDTSEAISGGP